MSAIAGLDLGGTKVHLRALDEQTHGTLLDTVLPNAGWMEFSDDERARSLAHMVSEHLVPLGVTRVVAGVHGSDTPQQQQRFEEALREVVPTGRVVNDAELVIPAAGLQGGTGVSAGTGSCATSQDSAGRAFTVGGWGWVLGDDGGATGIVREAAKAVLHAWDNRLDDPLSRILLEALDADHPHELGFILSTRKPEVWARTASAVFTAEEQSSSLATSVLQSQARKLVSLVRTVKDRGGDVAAVAAGGGVFTGQDTFYQRFVKALHEEIPAVERVVRLETDPVEGALRLAGALTHPVTEK